MKICSNCGEKKEFSEFQKRAKSKDGLTASCKQCLSARDKARANDPKRIANRKAYANTPEGREARKRARTKWLEDNAIKRSAHIIIGNAVRDGKLIKRPCEECGCKTVHAHHDDYTKPLEVRWLCIPCHNKWHKENGPGFTG